FNFEIMKVGYKSIFKTKYFLIGFLSIIPFYFILKTKISSSKIRSLIYLSIISTLIAVIAGAIGKETGFNPVLFKKVNMDRNAGLMGMVLNHAHNLSYFVTILVCTVIALWGKIPKNRKLILLIVIAVCILGLYTSYTRGAILAFIAGVLGYFLKDFKKFSLMFLMMIAIGVSGYFIKYDDFQRQGSNLIRLSLWKTAIAAYVERPIFGWGYLN